MNDFQLKPSYLHGFCALSPWPCQGLKGQHRSMTQRLRGSSSEQTYAIKVFLNAHFLDYSLQRSPHFFRNVITTGLLSLYKSIVGLSIQNSWERYSWKDRKIYILKHFSRLATREP